VKHRDRYKWLLVANLAFMLCNLIIVLAWASDAEYGLILFNAGFIGFSIAWVVVAIAKLNGEPR
jgi:hypothetical protein